MIELQNSGVRDAAVHAGVFLQVCEYPSPNENLIPHIGLLRLCQVVRTIL